MVQPSAGSPGAGVGAAKGGGGGGAGDQDATLGLGPGRGPRCADVAEKLAQLFGWRHTYKVEKLQRCLLADSLLRQQQQQLQLRTAAPPAPPAPPPPHKPEEEPPRQRDDVDGVTLDNKDKVTDVKPEPGQVR
ncbi:hypothetical protein ONE63_008446 [Megalurothrips usitatus]|uniref:Uncharacterized protein n=1 Tax=Megalurothrips usitatus TaxID=439358 RepID=A0AAV7XNQ3_9NEOP|nr:hypothetical protein ONE63_008446 [Megalurothrips usitatus]